jgi:hypothetical protein
MAAGEHVSDLPACYHTFHLQCAADWLKTRVEAGQLGCCPVCNAAIFRPALDNKSPAGRRWLREPRLAPHDPFAICVFKVLAIVFIVTIIAVSSLCVQGIGKT